MNPRSPSFEEHRTNLIERLSSLVRNDPPLLALWLQGSLADGSADPWSDVDAYIAVEDSDFDEVYSARLAFVEQLGEVLAWSDPPAPTWNAIHCLMEGPVKLDLFFERRSGVDGPVRPAVQVLIDKSDLAPTLKTGWKPSPRVAAQRVDATIRLTRQGAAWPVRLLNRGQWSTLAMVELELINDQIALLMAAQIDPGLLFKNRISLTRLLREEQQRELDSLTQAVLVAVAQRDPAAVQQAHLRINDAFTREGRAACVALGIPYHGTEAGDAAIRAVYERDWLIDSAG